ncbi:unnamed protein product [Rhizophagus irregularis]|nr:unnamed protein product [Rhizophagus irregularis]
MIVRNLSSKSILSLNISLCKKCDKECQHEWCGPCQINNLKENFRNWTSENEKIDNLVQEMQLKIDYYSTVFEWIPYDQLEIIKEIGKATVNLAIWKDGPLYYDEYEQIYKKTCPNKKVILKYLYNSQNITNEFLNEVKSSSIKRYGIDIPYIYGISQNIETKDYIMVFQDGYCEKCGNWISENSENEKIDNFIQKIQLKINCYNDIIFEWIPYNQFDIIKEIDKSDFVTVHLAVWKDGPLEYDYYKKEYIRINNIKVALKILSNSQNIIDEFSNEVKLCSIIPTDSFNKYGDIFKIYGIPQNPNTKDYIIVIKDACCKKCGDKYSIYKYIDECDDIIFEWIPFNQFDHIEEIRKDGFVTIYLAIWKDGPLYYKDNKETYKRKSYNNYKKVTLKYLQNINEINSYSIKKFSGDTLKIYGISQDPNTKDYIMILGDEYCKECGNQYTQIYHKWCKPCQMNELKKVCIKSGNEKIDNFIQEMQSKIDRCYDIVLEWIPYDQFDEVNKIENNGFEMLHLALWKDGQLRYDKYKNLYIRINNKKVILKCIYNSQNIIDEFLNEVKSYYSNKYNIKIYGISQNPNTNDYIMVLQEVYCERCGKILYISYSEPKNKLCKLCQINDLKENFVNWTSGNEKIDNFIHQEMQLKMVSVNIFCQNCGNQYTNPEYGWCKLCQINDLREFFENWTSGNEKIDNYTQEMHLQIDNYNDTVVEWVPYHQFEYIKEIRKDGFGTLHLAIWKDGPLEFDDAIFIKGYIRTNNERVILKCIYNSQNITNEILSEAKSYSIKNSDNLPSIYGISQNPSTNDYILVLQDGYCEKCGEIYTDIKKKWCKPCQINNLKENFVNWTSEDEKIDNFIQEMQLKINGINNIVVEWIPYNQFDNIKEIGTGGFSTVYSAKWKDNILHYNASEKEYERYGNPNLTVALKCLYDSQTITNEFLNEAKSYSIEECFNNNNHILSIYGISQNPETGNYILVLKYANKGSLNEYINKIYQWPDKLELLIGIINGLKKIHENQMVHRDFHIGNILCSGTCTVYISDMGSCGEVCNVDKTKIYGVMPYVAPEVLRGNTYTQAADIYSFGMVMYFVATKRQPFANYAHDQYLASSICNGIRPEINESEIPKCYNDLMKKCWDPNPKNRPDAVKVEELIQLFCNSYNNSYNVYNGDKEIRKQFDESEEYIRANPSSTENIQLTTPEAYYTSRLLNPYTKDLLKCDNNAVMIDFTKSSIKNEND